jgi:hypothetical protein
MDHHQIAVMRYKFLLIGLDLHLRILRFGHRSSLNNLNVERRKMRRPHSRYHKRCVARGLVRGEFRRQRFGGGVSM